MHIYIYVYIYIYIYIYMYVYICTFNVCVSQLIYIYINGKSFECLKQNIIHI